MSIVGVTAGGGSCGWIWKLFHPATAPGIMDGELVLDVSDVEGAIWRGDSCCELLYRDVEGEVTADLASGMDVA